MKKQENLLDLRLGSWDWEAEKTHGGKKVKQRSQVWCEAATVSGAVWVGCGSNQQGLVFGPLETSSEVFQNKREILNQPLRLEIRENKEKNQTYEIDLKEREMRVEALRLKEGNQLSGVGSKDLSWPWHGEVENWLWFKG